MKKVFLLMITLLFTSLLIACNGNEPVEEDFLLPVLQGKNKAEVLNELTGAPITFTFDDTVNFSIPEGTFAGYGDNLRPGNKVAKGTEIVIYFAIHKNILPDLSGYTQDEAINKLKTYRLGAIDIRYIEVDDIEPGLFSNYGNGYLPGMEVPVDSDIIIFIAVEPTANHGVFISKYMQSPENNNALEIYNNTDKDVDLSKYVIDIYLNGSQTVSSTIQLSGILKAKETFVIAHTNAKTETLQKSHMTANLNYDGNDYIALAFKDHRIIDAVGMFGWALTTLDNRVIVRKDTTKIASNEFKINEWNTYAKDYVDVFGSHPAVYPTTFTFDKAYLENSYFDVPTGAIRVKYVSNNDGDTARFKIYDTGQNMDNSVRFVGIDTREMSSGDPMAQAAKEHLESLLANAKEIYLQWDPTTGLKENYGRYLALVWADGVLVNYEMVRLGYSQNAYSDLQQRFVYEGVSLDQWFKNAEEYAKSNNLGIWA